MEHTNHCTLKLLVNINITVNEWPKYREIVAKTIRDEWQKTESGEPRLTRRILNAYIQKDHLYEGSSQKRPASR